MFTGDGKSARLVVLHVAEPDLVPELPVSFGQQSVQYFSAQPDQARLQALEQKLRERYAPGSPIEVAYVVIDGEPAEVILRAAQQPAVT